MDTGQYVAGEAISLTASPVAGWQVSSWNGTANDASSATANTLTMPSSNRTVSVTYIQSSCYTLTRGHSGSGSDPVATPTKSPSCAAADQYVAGESIVLSASPVAGWRVGGWVGTANDASTITTNGLAMPPANHTVSVVYASDRDAYEEDGACSQARPITVNGAPQDHTFHVTGDNDWVRFSTTAGIQYRIEVQAPSGSPADVNLALYNGCDLPLASEFKETFTPGVRLDFPAGASGAVYLRLTNADPNVAGAEVAYRLTVRQLQQATTQKKGAVILLAGRLKVSDGLQTNIHHITNTVYDVFKQRGYSDDEIFYLASDATLAGYDRAATAANLEYAITTWAVDKVSPQQPLTLYLMDHGDADTFFVDEVNQQRINPTALNTWLNKLDEAVPNVKVTVIIEACYSGSFIEGLQTISKDERTVITSTSAGDVAYASGSGAQFSDRFLSDLREGFGLCMSFRHAQDAVQRLYAQQQPWIDVNGNRIPNEREDCEKANQQNPNTDQIPGDSWAPYIVKAQGPVPVIATQRTHQRPSA